MADGAMRTLAVQIPVGNVTLEGDLTGPEVVSRLVVFAHGSGSSRLSPRNRFVAGVLQEAGIATLLFDLLTPQEEAVDQITRRLRFDIDLLSQRLVAATRWVLQQARTREGKLGYFGASTGAAAALVAAAELHDKVGAVVSRGGRPDLAGAALRQVKAPTLLIVGGNDASVLQLNREALLQIPAEKKLDVISGATHLFEEPGTLEKAATLARAWFEKHLARDAGAGSG